MCKRQKNIVFEQNRIFSLYFDFENDDATNRIKKMRKQFVSGSRIRERDKKKAEYYVGDY